MRFATLIAQLSPNDLKEVMNAGSHSLVSDMDFLETLAAHKCFLITPWVIRANPSGQLARVARLTYDIDGNIDKPRVLLEVAREFRRARKRAQRFGGRFSIDP
jgi:hypothetical protein